MSRVPRPATTIIEEYLVFDDRLRHVEVIGGYQRGPIPAWREVGATGEPQFRPKWGNADSNNLSFLKDNAGGVRIKGHVQASEGYGAILFTLPVNYRPVLSLEFASLAHVPADSAGPARWESATVTIVGLEPQLFFRPGEVSFNTSTSTINLGSLNNIAFPTILEPTPGGIG